jgi:hypothetical protein
MIRVVIAILLVTIAVSAIGQTDEDIQTQIERIISTSDESDNQTYYETLMHYYQNPIDLNECLPAELINLGILSKAQMAAFFNYRLGSGRLQSIYELQAIPEFDITTIRALLPFVTLTHREALKTKFINLIHSNSNYIIGKYSRILERQNGYISGKYRGDPGQAQLRFRMLNPGHASIGITLQKDPGELLYSPAYSTGIDFTSAHIFLQNQGFLKQLAIGDFKLQFGQGLLLGSGFMIGKNAESITTIKQGSLGIMPYSSVTEVNFFRGAATSIELPYGFNLSIFYSNRNVDATLITDSTTRAISSIRKTGLHRTQSEIMGRNIQNEETLGTVFTYSTKKFNMGVIALSSSFKLPIIPSPTGYNQYYFSGDQLLNFGWFGDLSSNNFTLFSELAKSVQGGLGWTLGAIASLGRHVDLSMLVRSFDKDFYSFYGLPFSEQSTARNESGIYWGLKLRPVSRLELSAYYDIYSFPWLTASAYAPASGKEFMIRANYSFNKSSKLFIQVKSEEKEGKNPLFNIPKSSTIHYFKTVINFDYNLLANIQFRTRLQWNYTQTDLLSAGMLVYQDLIYSVPKIELTARFLLFDADNHLARLYTYEKDVLFTFNTQSFAGEGIRYFLLAKFKPTPNLSLRGKWSRTIYFDRDLIGSGNDAIPEAHKTRLTVQAKLDF